MVDAFAKLKLNKSLPNINADECNEFKMYLKRIKLLNEEVASNNEFYDIRVKELKKHNDQQTLKKEMYEMRVEKLIW